MDFARVRESVSFRLLVPAVLVLLLQIPVGLIASTIEERRATRDRAFAEVSSTWGGPQQITGPVLSVPILETWVDSDGDRHERTFSRRFLAHTLSVSGRVETE